MNYVRLRLNKTKQKRSERLREKIIDKMKQETLAAKERKNYVLRKTIEVKIAKRIYLHFEQNR